MSLIYTRLMTCYRMEFVKKQAALGIAAASSTPQV